MGESRRTPETMRWSLTESAWLYALSYAWREGRKAESHQPLCQRARITRLAWIMNIGVER